MTTKITDMRPAISAPVPDGDCVVIEGFTACICLAAAHAIYVHTARVGRTPANIEREERVCFSVSEMGRLLPAEHALKFSVEYAGVTVFGRARVLSDAAETRHGLQLLLDKYFPHLRPGRDYRAITDDELARTAVYRIEIEHWSGKAKAERADFSGAFHYPVQPGE